MRLACLVASCILWTAPLAHAEDSPFRVPDGFTVTKFAGDDLTHDTWAMTIDTEGRVAVSGPNYIKILLDTDQDGVADKSHLVSSNARNAHGLLFVGSDLLSVQPHGIFRHRDTNRDGLADGAPELFYKLPGGGGEHGPHGIRQGPDGWFYIACGNNTKIGEKNITTSTSPIVKPSQGTVLRISPDGKQSEVIAHGFRNHYDLAFNAKGHLFTFDSDGERDHQLPWYSYCRVFHVRIGGHHGWLLPGHQRSFNRPPYFFDSVDRLAQIDRGSPTGVEVYRHTAFPAQYQNGLFFACWTYGRVYFLPLEENSDQSYQKHLPETFMETTGHLGFAPSDLAVHPPSGDLFVSVGGRGTRGSIYRVSHTNLPDGGLSLPAYDVEENWSIHDQLITLPARLTPDQAIARLGRGFNPGAPQAMLDTLRHFMLSIGDISTSEARRRIDAGYTAGMPEAISPEQRQEMIKLLGRIFPTGRQSIDWEIARLLGMLAADAPETIEKVAYKLGRGAPPSGDAHYLFCLSHMPGKRSPAATMDIARGFLQIDRKLKFKKLLTDRNWQLNLREAFAVHLELAPELAETFLTHDQFGDPQQAYLIANLPKDLHARAAKRMLARAEDFDWTAEAVRLVQAQLPAEEVLPLVLSLWNSPGLRPTLASYLDKHGTEADKKLVAEFHRPPALEIDLAPFNERLAKIDWSTGDAARGQAAYARFTCSACHDGNTRLGPRLKGIAKRFSRDDLFRHINEPNLAVSDLYKAIQITTKDGITYVGTPVYSSKAQTIIETGTGETIRFSRHDIVSERRPNQSPMPPGLLLPASGQDLADLYAYLKKL